MKKYKSLALIAAVTVTLALSLTMSRTAQAGGEPIVVIVNSANPVGNLSMSELKKLWLSDRTRWGSGHTVISAMVAAGAPERSAFLKTVCGMNEADFSKYFLQAAFTGKYATPPREVANAEGVKNTVAGSPGAIGFIKASDFSVSDSGVKPVKIDGTSAANPAYKLRM